MKVLTFCLLAFFSFYTVFFLEDGNSDPFGMRFTTGKKKALIIGNSRGAQGLIPEEIESELTGEFSNLEIYNYCFAIGYSAFGPTYLNSILDKINPDTKNSLFIVTIDPFALVSDTRLPDSIEDFPETTSPLSQVKNRKWKPNLNYMLNWYEPSYYEIINRRLRPANEILHRGNGWLEVVLPMDSASVSHRVSESAKRFSNAYKTVRFSLTRMKYLINTIEALKEFGTVVMVYIPSHPDLMVYERDIINGFVGLIQETSSNFNIPFLDLSNRATELTYTEGIHLHQSSSRIVSKIIGGWINNLIMKEKI